MEIFGLGIKGVEVRSNGLLPYHFVKIFKDWREGGVPKLEYILYTCGGKKMNSAVLTLWAE